MKLLSRTGNERGIALVVALMATLLIVGLMAGAFAAINADQRLISIDKDQTQAYATAHAGLEKLTSDLAALFNSNVSPTVAEINVLMDHPPELAGYDFIDPADTPVEDEIATSGYRITWDGVTPTPLQNAIITSGSYQGLRGIVTPYTITVTARSETGGAEVRLRRSLNTVAVPVFQFGVFSERDLTFYAGDNFDFGGRVHTNGNLFITELGGYTMTFRDKITAVGNVVRSHMSNNELASTVFGTTGTVRVVKNFPSTFETMGVLDDSVKGSPGAWTVNTNEGAAATWKGWSNISNIKFNGNIKNYLTGAKALNLPLVDPSVGAEPIDLIRRPASSDEDTANSSLFEERMFKKAALRILLSDRTTDITNLPTVSSGAPVALSGNWTTTPPTGYVVDATHPPIALSPGPILNTVASSSTYSSGVAQIFVSGAIVDGFKIPTAGLSVSSSDGNFTGIVCTGKTASTFIGCNMASPNRSLAGNGTVSVTMPSGITVTAATTGSVSAGTNRTITLVTTGTGSTTFPTQPFSLSTFSVGSTATNAATSGGVIVTCEGYNTALSPQRFTNCRGLPAAPSSGFAISTHALSDPEQPLIGGFIKVERRLDTGLWTDVTMEILNLGIGARNQDGTVCADPTPNAILRIQRLRDNGGGVSAAHTCTYGDSRHFYDWWPNVLYDAREGAFRDVTTALTDLEMGGIMHYVSLDVGNLKSWLNGDTGTTGDEVLRENAGTGGYIVYFSDHRGNHRVGVSGEPETGEYGYEDTVNRNQTNGAPNSSLDLVAEDVNGNGVFDIYGRNPWSGSLPVGFTGAYNATATHVTNVIQGQARVNKAVLFRRALKLVNGGITSGVNNMPTPGLTIATDNPVYIQGNYNATSDPNTSPDNNTTQPNVPASVLADAVTLLSTSWRDTQAFRTPYDRSVRNATTTGYRVAVIAGSGLSFPLAGTSVPSGTSGLFGTEGGVGNFLRLLEDWSGHSINYRGSIVALYTSRQATGTFKYGPNVYVYSTRNFKFENDFLQPALLPPGTPMFRDLNTLNFRQILRPNQ